MNQIVLRLHILLCSVISWTLAFAQDDDFDDTSLFSAEKDSEGAEPFNDLVNYQPLNFDFYDLLLVILLLLSCYVFGKIWKGCSYLLLAVAALFFYLTRY